MNYYKYYVLLTEFWVNYICFNYSIDGGGRKYADG